MLDIVPQRWFSWDFTISQGAQPVANLDMSWWCERGALTVQGVAYRVSRERMLSGDFLLESERGVLARATKPSFVQRLFTIQHGAKRYTLRPRSAFRRAFVLLEDDREAGAISPAGLWSRRASAHLPSDLPLPLQVFLIWLTMLMWKREADSASSG